MLTLLYAVTVYDLHMILKSVAWYWVLVLDVITGVLFIIFAVFRDTFRGVPHG
jgi:hypothetical protein